MSSTELMQLKNCLEHFADILGQLGVTEAKIAHGKASFRHDGSAINAELMDNLCRHMSSLCGDSLLEDKGEDLDPEYFV